MNSVSLSDIFFAGLFGFVFGAIIIYIRDWRKR